MLKVILKMQSDAKIDNIMQRNAKKQKRKADSHLEKFKQNLKELEDKVVAKDDGGGTMAETDRLYNEKITEDKKKRKRKEDEARASKKEQKRLKKKENEVKEVLSSKHLTSLLPTLA